MDNESGRAKPKQKRGEQRVAAILNAASEVFAEVGYDDATTIMIAARVDTSIGSLYQFFANKEAILKALVERYVERASAVFAAIDVESFPDMTMEDGSVSMEREQLSQMASRQITFIDHLEKALMRIENKTYGVCRVTGRLIDKARLRAVPHATLSIEAKQMMNK